MGIKFNPETIRLVIGLGNPGEEYENTYHNIGGMFVRHLAEIRGTEGNFKEYKGGKFSYLRSGNLTLVIPEVYMNESGFSVKRATEFFNVSPEEILVVHDENDLPFGEWKMDFGRGAAGHRGVGSVIEDIGTDQFWRLRFGMQIGEEERKKAGDIVLSPISKERKKILLTEFERISSLYFS